MEGRKGGSIASTASLLSRVPPPPPPPPRAAHACPLPQIPSAYTQGRELPINQVCDLLRGEVAMAGYMEVLTW
jgi:hypothetical protein